MSRYEEHLAAVAERRQALGFLPHGQREPIDYADYLVEVWRLASVARVDDARRLLVGIWGWAMDNGRDDQEVRVSLRLLDRLGFATDDPGGWAALPDPLTVYRVETSHRGGLCWSLRPEVAETMRSRLGLGSVVEGRVAKADVLAYITHLGEDEIVAHRPSVQHADARQVPPCLPPSTPENRF